MTTSDWPPIPATVRQRTRTALAADDSEESLATALALLDAFGTTTPTDRAIAEGVQSLAEPAAAPTLVSRVAALIDAGLDQPDPYLSGSAVDLLFDLVGEYPATVDSCAETLRRLNRLDTVDRRIDELLATLGQSRPKAVASFLDIVTAEDDAGHGIRPVRGWVLAGAARAAPEPFHDPVDTLRTALADGTYRSEAARRLGAVGLVAPSLAAPTIPALVDATDASDDAVRTAAIEALGRVAGTERSFDGRFGHPAAKLDPALLNALNTALWTDDTATAATALGRVGAHDPARADRVVPPLCARLDATEDDETRAALLSALERLVPGTAHDDLAVRRCLAVVETATDAETLDDTYAVLEAAIGAGALSDETQETVCETLQTAISEPDSPAVESAIAVADAWVAADGPAPDTLANTLLDRLADTDSPSEELVSALDAFTPTPAIRASLRAAFATRSTNEAATEVLCSYDDDQFVASLVTDLVEDCAAALRDGEYHETPEKTGLFRVDYHLSDEQRALAEAVETVADDDPESVVPHVETLAALVTDETVSPSLHLLRALACVATAHPDAARPVRDALRATLTDGATTALEASPLLATLAATGPGDGEELEPLVSRYRASALDTASDLDTAFDAFGEHAPPLALQALPLLSARIRADDRHGAVGAWLHQLPALARTDARFALVVPEPVKPAFQADDNLVRQDAADVFTAAGAGHPAAVRRFRPKLEAAMYDTDEAVTAGVLDALGAVGDPRSEPHIDYATAYPLTFVRDAASDARAAIDSNGPASPDCEYALDGDHGVDPDDAEVRQRRVATLLAVLTDESAQEPAVAALADVAAVGDRPVVARLLEDDDPVVRALAASTAPALATDDRERRAAILDALTAAVAGENTLCRRWAADALGRLGERHPDTAAAAVTLLADHLPTADAATQTVFAGALVRLGRADPDSLPPAVEPLLDCCDHDATARGLLAAEALTYADPAELAATSGAAETALALTESDRSRLARLGNTLLVALASADPETLTGHVESFVEGAATRKALVRVVDAFPDSVCPYEAAIADMGDSTAVRRILAALHSASYPELLTERVESDEVEPFPTITGDQPDTVGLTEFETFVEFLVTVPDPDRLSAALDCVRLAADDGPLRTATLKALRDRCSAPDEGVRRGALASLTTLLDGCGRADVDTELATSLLFAVRARATADSWAERSDTLSAIATLLETWPDAVDDSPSLVETLLAALADDHEWPRRHAAQALGRLPATTLRSNDVPAALSSLADGDRAARRGAALAVGFVCPAGALSLSDAYAVLDPLTTASDRWVRQQAVESAVRIAQGVERVARDRASGRAWRVLAGGPPRKP